MHQSTDINELMGEWWDRYSNCAIPVPCTLHQALEFTQHKYQLNDLVRSIRKNRFNNDTASVEDEKQFAMLFDSFSKSYFFNVLKNGQ